MRGGGKGIELLLADEWLAVISYQTILGAVLVVLESIALRSFRTALYWSSHRIYIKGFSQEVCYENELGV